MKKNILIIVLLLAVLSAYFAFQNKSNTSMNQTPTPTVASKSITVSQRITVQSENEKYDTLQIQEGKTALDLLMQSHKTVTKGEGKNAFVTAIDGKIADDSKKEFWAFYLNGKQAEVGAGSYILKPNDKIEWKIETY